MEIYTHSNALQAQLDVLRPTNTIGFVPTMGALHGGHISLIRLCRSICDITVASIFVNPTQFNDANDYKRYPRTLDTDLAMLDEAGCDIVFTPSEHEVYPVPDRRQFDFGALGTVMEGACRPGHFNGVAQVVSRLFELVSPNKAVFGQKDLQQVAIIKRLVAQLGFDIEIVVAPIVRESNGLAMSSRNSLLSVHERISASNIYAELLYAFRQSETRIIPVATVKAEALKGINSVDCLRAEYFEIVEADSLQPVNNWDDAPELYACTAVYAGKVRLIDNIRLR